MNTKLIVSSIAALAVTAAPVAAMAQETSTAPLTQDGSVATGAQESGSADGGGGGALSAPGAGIALALAAAVIAGGIYLVVDDNDNDNDDSPDSP